MLKMKIADTTKTAAEMVADGMHQALATMRRPAALELAERNLAGARAKRAETATAQNDRLREFNRRNSGATAPSAEIRAGEAELAKHDETIKAARAKLAEARTAFEPAFLAAIAEPTGDIAAEIATRAAEIEKLTDALAEARRTAERLGIEAPRLLGGTYAIREHIAGIRRMIGR